MLKDDIYGGKVVHYNCGFIHGGGHGINVLKKWVNNASGGLVFLHNAKISQDLCEVMGHHSLIQG